MVFWLLFCINICCKSISALHLNCTKTFLFPIEQVTIQSPQENSQHLNSKVDIFHYVFTKRSYFITTIQFKLVAGIICIYVPILLYFIFLTHLTYNVQLVGTHFQFHRKMSTPHHYKCKKVTE